MVALYVLLFLLGLAGVVGIAIAPMFMPWRQQLRWMVINSAMPDPFRFGGSPNPTTLQEVVVSALDSHVGGLLLHLVAPNSPNEQLLRWVPATADDVTLLAEWAVTAAPLLLVSTPEGGHSLHSECGCVGGLRNVEFGRPFNEVAPTFM
jgi:hypothetical protein